MAWWAIVLLCLGSAVVGGVVGYCIALAQVGSGLWQ
jgi:hypothetical protein